MTTRTLAEEMKARDEWMAKVFRVLDAQSPAVSNVNDDEDDES